MHTHSKPSGEQGEFEVVRRGQISWLTHPPGGTARIEAESSAFHALPVSVPEGDPIPHEATPGELLAITQATFLAGFVAEALKHAGSPADEIVVRSECTFAGRGSDRELTRVELHVRGRVPGLDSDAFGEAVAAARPQALRATGARDDLPVAVHAELA
jgi:osmotically inducible protein OsmC